MTDEGVVDAGIRGYTRKFWHNYDNSLLYRHAISRFFIAPLHGVLLPNDGIKVMDEDWDNLIVLDACRADLFEDVVDMKELDHYERVRSAGSATPEWGIANFRSTHGDTVYINANPHLSKIIEENGTSFHQMIDVWETDFDDEMGTVRAENVVEAAVDAHKNFSDKRLIVHFLQPHFPFLREEDGAVESIWSWKERRPGDSPRYEEQRPTDPFDALEMGVLSKEEVWEGYVACLEYVMARVWNLLEEVNGKTVLTSDHGNCLGERQWPIPIRQYGHPKYLRSPELTTVPWAIVEGEDRRRVVSEGTHEVPFDEEKEAEIEDQLKRLGYF